MKKTHQRFSRQYWNDSTFAENTQEPDLNLVDLTATRADDNIRIDPIATDFCDEDPIDRLLTNAGFDDVNIDKPNDDREPCLNPNSIQEKTIETCATNDFTLDTFIADCLTTRNSEDKQQTQPVLIVEPIVLATEIEPEPPVIALDNNAAAKTEAMRNNTVAFKQHAPEQQQMPLYSAQQDATQPSIQSLALQLKRLQIAIALILTLLSAALLGLVILYNQQITLKTEAVKQNQWLELIKEELNSLVLGKE